MASLAEKIVALRKYHQDTQAELAKAVRLSLSTIGSIEAQKREKDVPSLDTALRIAYFYGAPLAWYLREAQSTEPPYTLGLAASPIPDRAYAPQHFGPKLRLLRLAKRESVHQLGKQIGRRAPYLTRIEWGKNKPSFEVALTIADYYAVSVDILLWDDDLLVDMMRRQIRRNSEVDNNDTT